MDERDPIYNLEKKRRELVDRWVAYKNAANRQAAEFGFWGIVGGVAIAADFALLGGLGTTIAVFSGASFLGHKRQVRRIEKELKEVDRTLETLYEDRRTWSATHQKPTTPTPNLSEEFSPAAKRQIDALKARLEELEKQMDKVAAENDHGIDKPKFKPPAGPKQ